MWDGLPATIPSNYHLCDGTGGTPDLKDKFILGTGIASNPGDIGGALTHKHSYDTDGHTHDANTTHDCPGAGSIESATVFGTGQIAKAGTNIADTSQGGLLPPYYVLAYIQRIS